MSPSPEDLRPAEPASDARLAEAEAERLRAERIASEESEARYRAEKAARRATEARERAEAEARERTETLASRLAEAEVALAAAAARESALAAEAAAQAAEARAAATELGQLRDYGAELETRHQRLLTSRGWRLLEPARRAARALRGAKPPAPFQPRLGPASRKKKPAKAEALPAPKAVSKPLPAADPPPAAPVGFAEAPIDPRALAAPPSTGKVTGKANGKLPAKAKAGGRDRDRKKGKDGKDDRRLDPSRALGAQERHMLALDAVSRATGAEELIALSEEVAARRGEGAAFLSRFARLLALADRAAFTEVAALAEEIAARFSPDWIEVSFPPAVPRRLAIVASTALTRIGRGAEARALIDAAIARPSRAPQGIAADPEPAPALLLQRAELVWPEDPETARADLARVAEREPLPPSWRALLSWLDYRAGATPEELAGRIAEHRQTRLILASAALDAGDFPRYRAALNDFFTEQGLIAPIPVRPDRGADHFAIDALATPPDGAVTAAGPLVSVIMTTYQSRASIDWALGSLRAQTHANLEIFVVDDGSTDGTRERLAEIAAGDHRIRILLNAENLGTYCAKNRAMAVARGAYITFHDSDDWAHPERIATHVAAMEAEPALVATRSDWLRIEADGRLNFRRWKKRFQHPNPASTFLRRGVIETAGYFDSVRFGADSEYWFRLKAIFGRRIRSLPVTLGFGTLRAGSLTRAGAGSMDAENYAPARGAYSAAYLRWHAGAPPGGLKLSPRLGFARPFPAPAEMITAPPEGAGGDWRDETAPREFIFGISFASRAATSDWERTSALLGATLRSLINQSDPRFSVIICGHEWPALPELDDPRVLFLRCDIPPPKSPAHFRRDKMRKRRLIAAALRARGGGYFFPLDADDLVHRDLVRHVRATDNGRGYLVEKGFALDHANGVLAPIPGAWSVPFDRTCGSSAVLFFEEGELPEDGELVEGLYFNLFQSHAYWPIIAEEFGRPLDPVPFPAGVYVVNHAQNLSFQLQRRGVRTENIIRAIADHGIAEGARILADDFGQAG